MKNGLKNRIRKCSIRKWSVLLLSAVIFLCMAPQTQGQAQEGMTVYVTIADGTGKLALTQEAVSVTDADGDGTVTINDALYCAHEKAYEGGAAAGYLSAATEYGLSLNKLWGVENGGSYGYFYMDEPANSLLDPVAEGGYVNAYCYQDLTAWSDQYVYFNCYSITNVEEGGTVELKLMGAGYDENWNPVKVPVAGAMLTLNGVDTGVLTDSEGTAVISGVTAGIISARSDSAILVPPVCRVVTRDAVPQTGDTAPAAAYLLLTAAVLTAAAVIVKRSTRGTQKESI